MQCISCTDLFLHVVARSAIDRRYDFHGCGIQWLPGGLQSTDAEIFERREEPRTHLLEPGEPWIGSDRLRGCRNSAVDEIECIEKLGEQPNLTELHHVLHLTLRRFAVVVEIRSKAEVLLLGNGV